MSSKPDGATIESQWAATRKNELSAEPIHGRLAIWGPRIATVGFLGLNLWRAQWAPGPHGIAGLTFALFGTSQWDRFAAKRMALTLASPLLIWTVEGYRAANSMTPLALPFLFGIGTQLFGIERVVPIYYTYSIFSRDAAGTDREVDSHAAVAVFPATVVGHVLPSILMSILPLTATEVSRSYFTLQSIVCYAFYFSPITVSFLTKGTSAIVKWLRHKSNPFSTPVDDTANVEDAHAQASSDLPDLKLAYSMLFAFQSVQHLSGIAELVQSIFEALKPFSWADRKALLEAGIYSSIHAAENPGAVFSSSPMTLFTLSTFAFLLHTVWDLRTRGYITNRELSKAVLSLSVANALLGSGAAYAGVWYWRENVLYRATQRSRPQSDVQN